MWWWGSKPGSPFQDPEPWEGFQASLRNSLVRAGGTPALRSYRNNSRVLSTCWTENLHPEVCTGSLPGSSPGL